MDVALQSRMGERAAARELGHATLSLVFFVYERFGLVSTLTDLLTERGTEINLKSIWKREASGEGRVKRYGRAEAWHPQEGKGEGGGEGQHTGDITGRAEEMTGEYLTRVHQGAARLERC